MLTYLGRRLVQGLAAMAIAITLAFVAMQLAPGDPATALLAASGATQQEVAERRQQLGLDDPLPTQCLRFLADLLRGDLGSSWLHGRPVGKMVVEQAPATIELALAASAIGAALGIGLGVLGATRRGRWCDTLATALAVVSLSTPTYWSGLLAILVFSLRLRWFPSSGAAGLHHLVLPALVLGVALAGSVARLVRVRVAEVLEMPFVTAARARGLPTRRVLAVHVLRPALGPALTVIALQTGFLLGGAVVTESVFARPGLGKLVLDAVLWRDLPVLRGVILVGAAAYTGMNLVADLAVAWLDPRLRERLLPLD